MSTMTFVPDANPESTSVDGVVNSNPSPGDTWANVHAGTSLNAFDSFGSDEVAVSYSATDPGWFLMSRGIMLFDTSALPDDANISAATLSLYITAVTDSMASNPEPQLDIVDSNPGSNTSLSTTDYGNVGTTRYASGTDLSSLTTNAVNVINLNATGIAAIDVSGITKFGLRINCDTDNSEPTDLSTNLSASVDYDSGDSGTPAHRPTLTVTYTSASASASRSTLSLMGVG